MATHTAERIGGSKGTVRRADRQCRRAPYILMWNSRDTIRISARCPTGKPYRHEGFWVFDDDEEGLRQEPFVARVDGSCLAGQREKVP